MKAALAYEWTRMRTIRSSYWISGIAAGIGIGISFLISLATSIEFGSTQASDDELEFLAAAIVTQFAAVAGPYLVAYILMITAVLTWGHEYRHGMIRITLTAHNSRTQIWWAKFIVLGVWTMASLAIILLGSTLVGVVWLGDDGVRFANAALLEQCGRAAAYTLVFVWAAGAITSIVRNQTAALVIAFVWPLAIEPLVGLIVRLIPGMDELEEISKFFPYNAGDRILRNGEVGRAVDSLLSGDQLSTAAGFAVFGSFCALAMAVSFVLFRMRDA